MNRFDPTQAGHAILWNGTNGQAITGENPLKTHAQAGLYAHPTIGYLAYPNPSLKNTIPDARFYEYKKLRTLRAFQPECTGSFSTSGALEASVSKAQYIKTIQQIHKLLKAGEIYQLNYAVRFRKRFSGDPYVLFCKWLKANPTQHAAYLNAGDFQIISASPERLLRIKNGKVRAEPIKGTVAKSGGKTAFKALMASEKERAELDMITDLTRNDIGKICQYGSLNIVKNRAIMELPNLWHTYSVVEGSLSPGLKPADVLDALFPGGSITGCPKKRAMQYIESLEKLPRNIFTGSIGFIKPTKQNFDMDFNIAIRTALVADGMIEYWAGGGIVADSDPEAEYQEVMLKAERFLGILES